VGGFGAAPERLNAKGPVVTSLDVAPLNWKPVRARRKAAEAWKLRTRPRNITTRPR